MKPVPADLESRMIQKLIDLVLQQSNLMAQMEEIFYAVEEDLATQYTEDELTDKGNIYVVYRALDGGNFSPELSKALNETQQIYLRGLAKAGHIEMSIVRRDCLTNSVSIPLVLNPPTAAHHAKFTFTLTIEADLDASVITHVKGSYANISMQDFCKVVEAM
jgi:hypothetical protein